MNLKEKSLKTTVLSVIFIGIVAVFVYAQSTGTGTGGSAQNTISSGGGGGGSGNGNVSTTNSNTFVAGLTNTFNGLTITSNLVVNGVQTVNGAETNNGPMVTSNLVVRGTLQVFGNQTNYQPLLVTNVLDTSSRSLIGGGANIVFRWDNSLLDMFDSSGVSSLAWGGRTLYDSLGVSSVSWSSRVLRDNTGFIPLNWQSRRLINALGDDVYNWSNYVFAVSQTFNSNITVTGTILGSNITGLGSGTITNTTSFTSINSVMGSNVVATATDGIARWSSGTNLTGILDVNLGAGTLQTKALYTNTTNSPSANLPLINAIYTNNTLRMVLNVGVAMPTGITTISGAACWTVNGTATQYMGMVTSPLGASGAITNTIIGHIQPSALYMITNIATAAGAPNVVQGLWNETRQ